jgi:hypothetical protein
MADKEVGNLTAADDLGTGDLAHIVQGGNSRKLLLADHLLTGDVAPTTPWSAAKQERARANIGIMGRGFIDGLVTSNNGATPNTKIDVAAGVCRDDTNALNIVFAAAKTIDCGTTGANALDTGALVNNTWYHIFAIVKADGTAAALASTSVSAPTMPSGYTLKRRIGSFKTDGSAHIVAYLHDGERFLWGTPVQDVNVTNPGASAVTRTLTVPAGVRVRALLSVHAEGFNAGGPGGVYISDLSLPDNAAGSVVFSIYAYLGGNTTQDFNLGAPVECMTNTSAQVRSRLEVSAGSTQLKITTNGWIDARGRNA